MFDLVGETTRLPDILVHRLRQQVVQAGALVFLLTEPGTQVVGPSTVALRLNITRTPDRACRVTIDKSRLSVTKRAFTWAPGA